MREKIRYTAGALVTGMGSNIVYGCYDRKIIKKKCYKPVPETSLISEK